MHYLLLFVVVFLGLHAVDAIMNRILKRWTNLSVYQELGIRYLLTVALFTPCFLWLGIGAWSRSVLYNALYFGFILIAIGFTVFGGKLGKKKCSKGGCK